MLQSIKDGLFTLMFGPVIQTHGGYVQDEGQTPPKEVASHQELMGHASWPAGSSDFAPHKDALGPTFCRIRVCRELEVIFQGKSAARI